MTEELYIGDEVYEVVPEEVRIAVEHLVQTKDRLGIPDDFELCGDINGIALRYVLEVYRVWAALYPEEHRDFIDTTEIELKYERPVKESLKKGGYSPTSFPVRFDRLLKVLLPKLKTQSKHFWKPLFSHIPELRRSNFA